MPVSALPVLRWHLHHNGCRIGLLSIGMNPINNIVDITNFVLA